MKTIRTAGVLFAFCAGVFGCAGSGTSPDAGATTTLSGTATVSPRDAQTAIHIGSSTQADLIASLGTTTVIRFDSGFEVWVYKIGNTGAADEKSAGRAGNPDRPESPLVLQAGSEFLVLFTPSGIASKTRIRPAPPVRQ